MSSYSVLSPYLIPPELAQKKRVNIGDGFILEKIKNLLAPHTCSHVFSTRKKLSAEQIQAINRTQALLIAGANQLNDRYTVTPGMTLEELKQITVPIIPFGVGFHGIEAFNTRLSEETIEILRWLHQKLRFSSWRCPRTVAYIRQFCPELSDKLLMTGCPVMYATPVLLPENNTFIVPDDSPTTRIALTITDREAFWQREQQTLDFVAERFPKAQKVLALHQAFDNPSGFERFKRRLALIKPEPGSPYAFHQYAQKRGFALYEPPRALSQGPEAVYDCWRFYQDCDLHIGSRLHAHLYCLSQGKPSFLTYVDDRCVGFAEALQFPICDPAMLAQYLTYDFGIYRQQCTEHWQVMQRFVAYVKQEVL